MYPNVEYGADYVKIIPCSGVRILKTIPCSGVRILKMISCSASHLRTENNMSTPHETRINRWLLSSNKDSIKHCQKNVLLHFEVYLLFPPHKFPKYQIYKLTHSMKAQSRAFRNHSFIDAAPFTPVKINFFHGYPYVDTLCRIRIIQIRQAHLLLEIFDNGKSF